jgi:hypothetical protein
MRKSKGVITLRIHKPIKPPKDRPRRLFALVMSSLSDFLRKRQLLILKLLMKILSRRGTSKSKKICRLK